jgi:5'-nucleotidase
MKKSINKYYFLAIVTLLVCTNSGWIYGQQANTTTITILHTNDTHSRIESLTSNDKRYPGRAGYVNRSAIINNIKKEQKNTLLLDAGDFLQGTPYFNFYKGTLEVELMNRLGYVAATLGNHEFDLGVNHLAKILKKAKFSILNCNYDVSKSPLKKIIKPWIIIKLGVFKIGITGVGVNPEGLITPENFKGIIYRDAIESVNKTAQMLKIDKSCDYIICLSHLGYQQPNGIPSDIELAKKSSFINAIIGGHTHTLLEQPDTVINIVGKTVSITQCGSMGINIGRLDVAFQRSK